MNRNIASVTYLASHLLPLSNCLARTSNAFLKAARGLEKDAATNFGFSFFTDAFEDNPNMSMIDVWDFLRFLFLLMLMLTMESDYNFQTPINTKTQRCNKTAEIIKSTPHIYSKSFFLHVTYEP